MTKFRKFLPLIVLALGFVAVSYLSDCSRHRYMIENDALSIARDLISRTNSVMLEGVSPELAERLARLQGSPVKLEFFLRGDEPAPIGDGRACSRLIFANERGERLGIRLSQIAEATKYQVLGFWTPPPKPPEAK